MEVCHIDPRGLVFVDEMGTHTSLAPLYAYAPIGERAFFEVPRNRGKNTTLLTSMSLRGMGPSMAVEGATTSRVFETYVERLVAPALRPGQVVVMDNLGAHRPKRIRELIEERDCELVYLPPDSPDLNPIEEALSKIKHILRKTGARTKEALIEAGTALRRSSYERRCQKRSTHYGGDGSMTVLTAMGANIDCMGKLFATPIHEFFASALTSQMDAVSLRSVI